MRLSPQLKNMGEQVANLGCGHASTEETGILRSVPESATTAARLRGDRRRATMDQENNETFKVGDLVKLSTKDTPIEKGSCL